MDWDRKAEFIDVFEYYKGLFKLRREHSAFRMNSAIQIKKHLEFLAGTPKNTVAFILKNYANNDNWKDIVVIYNANREIININIPEGNWNVVADKYSVGTSVLRTFTGSSVEVNGISMSVLYR
jgi:pullulanase